MVDLARWLGQQLDEDERIARAATPSPWVDEGGYVTNVGPDGRPRVQVTDYGTQDGEPEEDNPQGRADSKHIAAWDPARVLREIDAKRKMLALHGRATLRAGGGAQYFDTTTVCRSCEPDHQFPELSWPCTTLRLLALPYADRPGYREEWRP